MATHYPSHFPADPTASSSSSRGTSDDPHFRPTSTESGTPLAAALQLEKPPSRDGLHAEQGREVGGGRAKGKKKKPHFKSFAEIADENLKKAEAGAGKRDPWITRKFAIGSVQAYIARSKWMDTTSWYMLAKFGRSRGLDADMEELDESVNPSSPVRAHTSPPHP